jgi:hypothetical protein
MDRYYLWGKARLGPYVTLTVGGNCSFHARRSREWHQRYRAEFKRFVSCLCFRLWRKLIKPGDIQELSWNHSNPLHGCTAAPVGDSLLHWSGRIVGPVSESVHRGGLR